MKLNGSFLQTLIENQVILSNVSFISPWNWCYWWNWWKQHWQPWNMIYRGKKSFFYNIFYGKNVGCSGIYIKNVFEIKLYMLYSYCTHKVFRLLRCTLWKLSILPPLWQCRSYFPPTLPLECLSMRLALPHLWMPPNTELALPLGTHTHTFRQKQCQADLRHVTILHHCLGPPLPL